VYRYQRCPAGLAHVFCYLAERGVVVSREELHCGAGAGRGKSQGCLGEENEESGSGEPKHNGRRGKGGRRKPRRAREKLVG
jgi:hypothetical protein